MHQNNVFRHIKTILIRIFIDIMTHLCYSCIGSWDGESNYCFICLWQIQCTWRKKKFTSWQIWLMHALCYYRTPKQTPHFDTRSEIYPSRTLVKMKLWKFLKMHKISEIVRDRLRSFLWDLCWDKPISHSKQCHMHIFFMSVGSSKKPYFRLYCSTHFHHNIMRNDEYLTPVRARRQVYYKSFFPNTTRYFFKIYVE